jgi:hypothetical protein
MSISMRRSGRLMFLFIITILVSSCEKKGNDTITGVINTSSTIVPLVVGNQWEYIDSTFSTTGPPHVDSSKLGITGKISISYQGQSVEVFYWNWYDNKTNHPQDYKWLGKSESDGYYVYGGASSKGVYVLTRALSQKYPLSVGDTWMRPNVTARADSTFYIADTSLYRCVSVNQELKTAAGTFSACVYTYQRTRTVGSVVTVIDTYLYYVPSIGYVSLLEKQNGVITYRKLLRSYRVTTPS